MPFTVGQYLTANDLKSQEDAHTLGYGVVNGLKVVRTDPASMDVQVETGKAYVADTLVEKGAVTDLTVTAADPTNPRKDIVVCNSAGTLSIVAGTPEAALPSGNVGVYTLNPEPPSIPANSIILAEIWVPAGATEITGSEIYDKRVFTVDRLDMGRMPDMALDKVMVGQGAGSSPVEEDKPAGDMAKSTYDPDEDGKIALAQLVDAVCSETEAPILARTVAVIASDVLRNSNDTERSTTAQTMTKVKEVKLNADLAACRLKFDVKRSGNGGPVQVYKNGVAIGTSWSFSASWATKSQDFTGWVTDDLIQIYIQSTEGGVPVQVKNMQFFYSEGVTHIGGKDLTTNLPTETDPTISMTNQDP